MDFVSNQPPQIEEMLKTLGLGSVEDLFQSIPPNLRHAGPQTDDGMSESEVIRMMEKLAAENTYLDFVSYLGAGAYDHHVPAIVQAICSRSEFLTSYTPYQPEISQGMLQAIFEFQSAIAALTCMEVANAGVYDGASACAEAALMALRLQKDKKRVVIAGTLHPNYRSVVDLYLSEHDVEIVTLPITPQIDPAELEKVIRNAACVLIQSPNFLGVIEKMPLFAEMAHKEGALFIACGNPLAYGLLTPPGEYGADIAVGDCQPLGLQLNFGGPYAGYMACKSELVRQLPGRIAGQTLDSRGQKGFVLTLQAREQHIRREKATSNICTNQALATLASLITMLWYGPKGLQKLALTNYQRAHYLAGQLKGFKILEPFFNEFTVKVPANFYERFIEKGIIPGLKLEKFLPEWKDHLLVSVTELKTIDELKQYAEVAK